MANKRGPYKDYLVTGKSPPKSTKYDHAKKKKIPESGSSTDDMEEYYGIISAKLDTLVRKKPEDFISGHEEEGCLGGNFIHDSSQLHFDYIRPVTEGTSDDHSDEEFDIEEYEEPLPMGVRLGYADQSVLVEGPLGVETDLDGDLEDLDDGSRFWKNNTTGEKRSTLIDKLEDGKMDKVISSQVVVTKGEMLCAIQKFNEAFNLPTIGLVQMCKMFNTFLSKPVLPETRYTIDNFLRAYDVVEFHAVCINCNLYLRSFSNDEETVFCKKCENHIRVKGNNTNFFVILNIKDRIRELLQTNDEYYEACLLNNNQARTDIKDICDGGKYREFVSSVPKDNSNSYVSCVINSDGSPVWKAANFSIWPIQAQVIEIPPEVRLSKTLTCALWFGRSKSNMNIFIETFAKSVNTMNVKGISCKINNCQRTIRVYPVTS